MMQMLAQTLSGCHLLKRPQIVGCEIAARNTLHAVKAPGTASWHCQSTGDCIKALGTAPSHWGLQQGTVRALGTASRHCQSTGDCIRALSKHSGLHQGQKLLISMHATTQTCCATRNKLKLWGITSTSAAEDTMPSVLSMTRHSLWDAGRRRRRAQICSVTNALLLDSCNRNRQMISYALRQASANKRLKYTQVVHH